MEKVIEIAAIDYIISKLADEKATDLKLFLIQHTPEKDQFNTSLVIKGMLPSGQPTQEIVCPSPCRIGKTFS